jgi:uncharacterized repeat protein (TIGR01451 family)
MKALYLVVLLFLVAPVSAKEGFVERWSYSGDKAFTSLAPMDANRSSYLDHVLAGSLDNRVYLFTPDGDIQGYYESISSITSVASFIHDGDMKFNDGIAGSLDDHLYAFWRPYTRDYFLSYPHWWNYSLGDNVYAVGTFDYNGTGQQEDVVAGTGSYTDQEYGAVYALSPDGDLLWKFDTSSAVKILKSGDLDSDSIMNDVIVGAGSMIYVLNVNGSLIWKYDFQKGVQALSSADFDLDGEKDDILVGAGNTAYAINSHKQIQWKKNFNTSVSGISPVDIDNDGVIDYYLVSSGTYVYALKNGPQKAEILWDYNLNHSIDSFTCVDFDRDGIMDDIAIVSGRFLYAYDFEYLYLPDLKVTKTASSTNPGVGDKVTVTLHFKNNGRGIVKDVSYIDTIPEGFKLVAGNLSMNGVRISALGEAKVFYTVEALKSGKYILPPVKVHYSDGYGRGYTTISSALSITTKEGRGYTGDKTNKVGAPALELHRNFSNNEVSPGENLTILVSLINQGNAPALTVNFEGTVPEGFVLVGGKSSWKGVLEPGEKKDISYTLQLKNPFEIRGEVKFPQPLVYYRDVSGKMYEARGEETTLKIKNGFKTKTSMLIFILILAAALLYKRMIKSETVDPGLEEKFIQVYLRYQKEGRRPTYREMKEELGIDDKEVDVIVNTIKKRFGISPFNALFSRIKSLRK